MSYLFSTSHLPAVRSTLPQTDEEEHEDMDAMPRSGGVHAISHMPQAAAAPGGAIGRNYAPSWPSPSIPSGHPDEPHGPDTQPLLPGTGTGYRPPPDKPGEMPDWGRLITPDSAKFKFPDDWLKLPRPGHQVDDLPIPGHTPLPGSPHFPPRIPGYHPYDPNMPPRPHTPAPGFRPGGSPTYGPGFRPRPKSPFPDHAPGFDLYDPEPKAPAPDNGGWPHEPHFDQKDSPPDLPRTGDPQRDYRIR